MVDSGATNATAHRQPIPDLSEWRFEVADGAQLRLRLVEGFAEIFGAELARGTWYEFTTQKAAVFSWKGATIEWEGEVNEYMSSSTPMATYANLHLALDAERESTSEHSNSWGPSVLILGPSASGKTSLAKILSSYGTKRGSKLLIASLDPACPAFGPPGALAAAPAPHLRNVESSGWGDLPISGPVLADSIQPIAYWYGFDNVVDSASESSTGANPRFYRHCVSQLALAVGARFDAHAQERKAGLIIDTPSDLAEAAASGSADAHSTLARIIAELRVSVVAVVGSERLYADLQRRFSGREGLALLSLPKSGGVVAEDAAFRRRAVHIAVQRYFYGTRMQPLSPFTTTVRFNALSVMKVISSTQNSVLGAGAAIADQDAPGSVRTTASSALEPCPPSAASLENAVLAVVNASPNESADTVAESEVLGYVHIAHVDDEKRLVRMLLPVPGKAPAKTMILGALRYFE